MPSLSAAAAISTPYLSPLSDGHRHHASATLPSCHDARLIITIDAMPKYLFIAFTILRRCLMPSAVPIYAAWHPADDIFTYFAADAAFSPCAILPYFLMLAAFFTLLFSPCKSFFTTPLLPMLRPFSPAFSRAIALSCFSSILLSLFAFFGSAPFQMTTPDAAAALQSARADTFMPHIAFALLRHAPRHAAPDTAICQRRHAICRLIRHDFEIQSETC